MNSFYVNLANIFLVLTSRHTPRALDVCGNTWGVGEFLSLTESIYIHVPAPEALNH